jgi:hypothetical protein
VSRFVVKPLDAGASRSAVDMKGAEPLEDTGLFVVEAKNPREVLDGSGKIAWAAPTVGDTGQESYPTGEVSIRFEAAPDQSELDRFVQEHGLELRRRNEFVPEQVVVAPSDARKTWLPDLVEHLNNDGTVAKAWPNMLSRYRRN